MVSSGDEIARAYRRISVLKAIIAAERTRAESNPMDPRNVKLGIVEPDLSRIDAKDRIEETFTEVEMLLDHLHITHLAAAFELEARNKINNAIGTARSAIAKDRKNKPTWHERLVRGAESFEGLHDIEDLIAPPTETLNDLVQIRKSRNKFCHGVAMKDLPSIEPQRVYDLLLMTLNLLK
jgi:hypothetical protein